MIFREMNQSDIEYMKNHSVSRGILSKMPEQTEHNFALEHEDDVLGIGGIRMINTVTAWGWIDMSDHAGGHIVVVYRVIKEWMARICEEKGIKRLQAYIEPDFPDAVRMAQHLGFVKESVMECFLPDGRDAFMFVRIL